MSYGPEEDLRDRPIGGLMRTVANGPTTLVRSELELAKAEVAQKGKRAGVGAGMLGGAAVAALLALGALTAFLVMVLDAFMWAGLAALLVALLWGAIAGALALVGRKRLEEAGPPKPEQTVETIKEDIDVVKRSARSGRG